MYTYKPPFGGAFYHLNQSLLPEEVWTQLAQPEDAQQQLQQYDQYGFLLDTKSNKSAINTNNALNSTDEAEYQKRKAQWIRYLEGEYQKLAPTSPVFDLAAFDADLDRSSPFLEQLMSSSSCSGLPITNELRPFFWMRLSKALHLKINSRWTFTELSDQALGSGSTLPALTSARINQVLPTPNACFQSANSICAKRLNRVLAIAKWHQMVSGVKECQQVEPPDSNTEESENCSRINQPLIAAYLLLVCNEEETFWLLAKLSADLGGSTIERCASLVLRLLERCCPPVGELLRQHDIDFSLIAHNWFSSAFAGFLKDSSLLYAIWDLLLYEGPIFLVQFTLGLLIVESQRLLADQQCSSDSAQLFNELSDLPLKAFLSSEDSGEQDKSITANGRLLKKVVQTWKTGKNVINVVHGHYGETIIPQSLFYSSRPPSSFTNSISTSPVSSVFSPLCSEHTTSLSARLNGKNIPSPEYPSAEYLRLKNVKQTQLMVNLHEAVVAIAHHFEAYNLGATYRLEPEFEQVGNLVRPTTLNLPWRHSSSRRGSAESMAFGEALEEKGRSPESGEDLANRLRPYHRRAKALIDFAKEDNDELGFNRNDIITIVNEKDEHCWIGELNGEMGWFPAKFVELLDERSLDYSIAGDDSVLPFINDLVRGKLCTALKGIFFYDLKRTSYFVPVHPWTVLEEIHTQLASGGEFKQIYSRLVLTKTFRLDEFARVLSPSELLYRSMTQVNTWYGAHAPLDVKFRSLVCMGLNQYVLHDWLQLICLTQVDIIRKHYGPNSFLSAPVWKMIKAELK